MQEMLVYTRELKFAEDPDYDHLKSLVKKMYRKEGVSNDGVFDWLGQSGAVGKAPVASSKNTKTAMTKYTKLSKYFAPAKKETTTSRKQKKAEKEEGEKKSDKGCILF